MIHTNTRRSARALSAAGAVLCATALAAGCTSHSDKPTPPPSTPTTAAASAAPTPSSDPTADAKAQVLAVYKGMWDAQVKAYSTGTLVGTDLEKYAGDKALAGIKVTAVYFQDHNLVTRGEPKLSPVVTSIDIAGAASSATVLDCVDSSSYAPVNKDTGKPATLGDDNRRHPQTSVARGSGGTWLITETTIDRDKTC